MSASTCGRLIAAGISLLALALPAAAQNNPDPSDRWNALSQRDKTFLIMVFEGNEAKAVEYAGVAGINVNAIGGEPLSVWFYRNAFSANAPGPFRNYNAQRIVFERFHQNPNPKVGAKSSLQNFCGYAPFPVNIQISSFGTPEQKRQLEEAQFAARKVHIDDMAKAFTSLQHYGLKDKHLVDEIFLGCFFQSRAPMNDGSINEYMYDTVISKLLRAGADINIESVGGERPLQFAVHSGYPSIIERLIRDGAQLDFRLRMSGYDDATQRSKCEPLQARSLYAYSKDWVRPRNAELVLRIVRALASGGVSAMTKWGYVANGQCVYKSFYDAVLDTGNIDFAKAVKAADEGAKAPVRTAVVGSPAQLPVAVPVLQPATEASFGVWKVVVGKDGRPIATSAAVGPEASVRELRIECVAGGRLEYVPVLMKADPARSLWIDGVNDTQNELPLANGRATGKSAATLSKEFLTAEGNARKDGAQVNWAVSITVNDANSMASMIAGNGFSQMRTHMLANCKS